MYIFRCHSSKNTLGEIDIVNTVNDNHTTTHKISSWSKLLLMYLLPKSENYKCDNTFSERISDGYPEAHNTATQKWYSIVQYSCTSIWDLQDTFPTSGEFMGSSSPVPYFFAERQAA